MQSRYNLRVSLRDSRQAERTAAALPPPGMKLMTLGKRARDQTRNLSSVGSFGKCAPVLAQDRSRVDEGEKVGWCRRGSVSCPKRRIGVE
jgi:hypothetical protein